MIFLLISFFLSTPLLDRVLSLSPLSANRAGFVGLPVLFSLLAGVIDTVLQVAEFSRISWASIWPECDVSSG